MGERRIITNAYSYDNADEYIKNEAEYQRRRADFNTGEIDENGNFVNIENRFAPTLEEAIRKGQVRTDYSQALHLPLYSLNT
jgi:hypothetical protein